MSLSDVTLLVCIGTLLGLGARYLLALDMRPHTAIYLGVLVVAGGPWLVDSLTSFTEEWSPGQIMTAAVVAVLVIGFLPALYAQLRKVQRQHHHPSQNRRGLLRRLR